MSKATLEQINLAANDRDLLTRVKAAAAEAGIPNPEAWAEANMSNIVNQKVSTNGDDTVASVYAYAYVNYKPTPRPGENEAAVTDDYIRTAVKAVKPQ